MTTSSPSSDFDNAEAAVQFIEDKLSQVEMHGNGTNDKITLDDDNDINDTNRAYLTGQEIWNIIFCFLAWACNVSIVTLGTFILITN